MSFVQVEQWQGATGPRRSAPARLARSPSGSDQHPKGASWRPRHIWRRSSSFLFTVLLHVLLLYFLINRVFGSGGLALSSGTGGESLVLMSLPGISDGEDQQDAVEEEEAAERPQEEPAPGPPVEAAAATSPDSKDMAVAEEVEIGGANGLSDAEASGAATGASGGGAQAGGGYDPLAGAAPIQPGAALAGAAVSTITGVVALLMPSEPPDPFVLDESVLESVRSQMIARYPSITGTLELMVRILPDGTVAQVQTIGGNAPPQLMLAFSRLLIGKPLFRPSGPMAEAQWRALPLIQLP